MVHRLAGEAPLPEADHDLQSSVLVANLRVSATRGGPHGRAAALVQQLREQSEQFERIWNRHDVTGRPEGDKTIVHPVLGPITLQCQVLFTHDHGQALLVFTASPGSEHHSKLEMLSAIGTQDLAADSVMN